MGHLHCAGLLLGLVAWSAAERQPGEHDATPVPRAAAAETVALSFRPIRDWDLLLPAEEFTPVRDGIPAGGGDGEPFATRLEGTSLWVDRDGDGEVDVEVEAQEPDEPPRLVVFQSERGGKRGLSYAVRLLSDGTWKYAPAGALVGTFRGTRLQLIDQNNNGSFADFGEDALIVGRGQAASFLSRVVHVGGELYRLKVAADGSHLDLAPYDGPSGTLDLTSELDSEAKVRAAVVQSTDGELSFELSGADGGLRIPAGEYALHSGQVVLGKARAELRQGRFAAVTVAAGERAVVEWGGPVEAEFDYERGGGRVVIAPWDIYYYGRAGEEYSNFMPLGTSPRFVVKAKDTGEVLVDAMFPGNC